MYSQLRRELVHDYIAMESQHDKISEMMVRLDAMIKGNQHNYTSIIIALDELKSYLDGHLSHEERLMMMMKYPLVTEHKNHHKSLRRELDFQRGKFHGADTRPCGDLIAFIGRWLEVHEQDHDSPLKRFLMRSLGQIGSDVRH